MKVIVAILALLSLPALSQDMFPMSKGTTWVYLARVKWGKQGTDVGGTTTLRWTMIVVDSVRKDEISAALLHGGPWDLAWYEPGVQPLDHLVVRMADTYYLLHDDVSSTFADIKAGKTANLNEQLADDIWFKVPLQISDNFCSPQNEDNAPFNCWSVEKVTATSLLKIPGLRTGASETEYFLSFMTNPDSEMLTLVPGAGIISWNYEHHGTVAEASLKLIEFRAPGSSAQRVHRRPAASKRVR